MSASESRPNGPAPAGQCKGEAAGVGGLEDHSPPHKSYGSIATSVSLKPERNAGTFRVCTIAGIFPVTLAKTETENDFER
jgi:hypothetical protein